MTFATLGAVLAEARSVFNNKKLRKADIQEWNSGRIEPRDGEVIVRLPILGINVALKSEFDKRAKVGANA